MYSFLEGIVVAISDNKLILNTRNDKIRVHLPADCTANNEVLTREELMTSGYMSAGETIHSCSASTTNKQTRSYNLHNRNVQANKTSRTNRNHKHHN